MRSSTPIEKERDVPAELKALRLHGMAGAWGELMAQGGGTTLESSRWLIEHLLQAEDVDRHMRSIAHQMKAARFPVHRDLAGFDFEVSQVDKALVQKLADLSFTEDAQNAVLIGGPGTGKTHLVRISAIVDACFKLIVDDVSAPSWTRRDARKRGINVSQTSQCQRAMGRREAMAFDS